MAVIDSITDYSRTQRVVLLIDVNPFLHLKDPNPYLSFLLSTAKNLLSFPPLSSSLFSFKPFFSSLSPLLSSSKLSIPSFSLSFNHPISTFESLTQTLTSILSTFEGTSVSSSLSPRAFHLASSIQQLVHDYAWDSLICESPSGTLINCESFIKSNLVVLLSPAIRSLKCLSEFFDVELSDECLNNVDGSIKKFCKFFESVNKAFVSRDIHFSWIDMSFETGCCLDKGDFFESELGFRFFESGIRDLGWGFCSSEAIVLGSALVPFGLIYPKIGILPRFFNLEDEIKTINGQLSLEIADVSGNPLECKFCNIELINLKMFPGASSKFMDQPNATGEQKKKVWGDFSRGNMKLHVKAVFQHDKLLKLEGLLSDPIIVSELSGDSEKDRKESCSGLFEDRVLEILGMEMGKLVSRKSAPVWEILFSFLYREDCWALVSLSNGSDNDNSLIGILKPFTVSLALLSIIRDEFNSHSFINEIDGAGSGQFVIKKQPESCKPKFDSGHSFELVGSQSGSSPLDKPEFRDGTKKKTKKKDSNMLQELTWSAFHEAALEHLHIDLEYICFARGYSKSKKMKFLKCWMRQMKKASTSSLALPERFKLHQEIPKEIVNRLAKQSQECEQPIASCSSVGDDPLTGASRTQDEVALGFGSETFESFFNDIPYKIQQGLESQEVDLSSLANRLVSSSTYWLYQKHEKETISESQIKSDIPTDSVVAELTKLLLRDPKDLVAVYRNSNSSFQASSLASTEATSENIVREYELQILFRMEILQFEAGASLGESTKQKYVKQICFLLENIQWHLQGGFFSDWSLDKYVGKIIKARYCESLGDVVQRIYAKMDLLLFEDEDESPNLLLNSEDSNQSWREKHEGNEMDENHRSNDPISAEAESFQPTEFKLQSPQLMEQDDHAQKLIEAQERRQRACKFASFPRRVPDLQRVWAPKQHKAMKVKSNPLRKLPKRKERRSVNYDTVCETPLTGQKYSCRISSSAEKDCQGDGTGFCSSVSKALFLDD